MCNTRGILLPCSVAASEQILYGTNVERRHHHYLHFYLGLWDFLFAITPVAECLGTLNILSATKATPQVDTKKGVLENT